MIATIAPVVLRTVPAKDVAIGHSIAARVDGRNYAGTVTARVEYSRTGEVVLTLGADVDRVRLAAGDPVGITRSTGDVALGTLASEPGGFGAAIARLGFGEGTRGDSWTAGPYWTFDHAGDLLRVVVYTDDGDRVELIGWDPARPAARLVSWKVGFDGTTPQSVVLAAIANAVGELPVTR